MEIEEEPRKQTFQEYLEANPNLSESTINVYEGVIRMFLGRFKEPTMANANEFLIFNYSKRRNYPYRYALKHYFMYLGREKEFTEKVLKVKRVKPKKKPGVYLQKNQLIHVINAIEEDMLKTIALMQMYSGCRSYEIINLKWGDIRTDKAIHVVETKSNKARVVRVPTLILERVLKMKPKDAKSDDYIFWDGKIQKRSLYRRYLYKLQKATGYILGKGMKMGTHDFRRNFARAAYEFYNNDLKKVQVAMGHSDIVLTSHYIGDIAIDKKKLAEGIYEDEESD